MWSGNFDSDSIKKYEITNSDYKDKIFHDNPLRSVFEKIFNYLENLSDIWNNVNATKNSFKDYKNWFRVETDKWKLCCDWFNNRNQKRIEFVFYIPKDEVASDFVRDFLLDWSKNKETILHYLKEFTDMCAVKDKEVEKIEQARLKKEQEFEEYAKNFVA